MKLLLDTNALLWWFDDNPKLGRRARALIANSDSELMTSIVSLWEVSVKHRVGKMKANAAEIGRWLPSEGIALVPVKIAHLVALEALPSHHKDPFDHLILAQAKVEGAKIVTSDRAMADYGIACVSTS